MYCAISSAWYPMISIFQKISNTFARMGPSETNAGASGDAAAAEAASQQLSQGAAIVLNARTSAVYNILQDQFAAKVL
jgi:hypothetical protein